MPNFRAARQAASKLHRLAQQMREQQFADGEWAVVGDAFSAAARALETAANPPPRHETLALIQVLTAGYEKMFGLHQRRLNTASNDVE